MAAFLASIDQIQVETLKFLILKEKFMLKLQENSDIWQIYCIRQLKTANSCRRIEHNLGSINAIHHPILWMVSTITNVYRNFAKLGFKNRVSNSAFHIIS
ncbi:hypothetical protein BpHYR1_023902 [Brachionus plicatilis]|uniref:Uncharacterized protein n=1 Tax=Brachionus plicatilis TaxID=10195 RepID=A0A3M7R5F9_BRAPC|nr:hypothetical protein BpHYR1_023902 [Brachionus plicatilis]